MKTLLNYYSKYSENTTRYPKHFPDNFEYLISRLTMNFRDINEINKKLDFYVQRPNIFTSLLNDIELIMTDDIFETYDSIIDDNIHFVNNYHFTTTKNKGKPLKNVILKNIDEFFLLEEDPEINLLTFEDEWRDYESIKVIATDNSEIVFQHLYKLELTFTNFIVYKVDVVGLVLQYFYWLKEQEKNNADTDSALFLTKIPFNNLLSSFNEISLSNMYLMFNNKKDLITSYNRHEATIPNIDNYILSVAKDWKKILNKQHYKDYYDFTKRFYPYTKSLYDINKIVTIINNQNEWLYLLSILNGIKYYLSFIEKDNEFISKLKIALKSFQRKNIQLNDIATFYLNNLIIEIEESIR